MEWNQPIPYAQVEADFLRAHDLADEYNRWAIGAIRIAEQQFGHWRRAILSPDDILSVMLPYHKRCGAVIVPPECSSVAEAIERLKQQPPDSLCRKKAESFSNQPPTLIFLSMAPINHPDYADYQGLVQRQYRGLTHLDGLHRLMGWALAGQGNIEAYVAGSQQITPA